MKFEPTSFAPDAQRILDFAKSEMFDRTFKEGMALVEETAAYLDGPGRAAAKRLSRLGALAYAGESMRLTTRLMQVASWLLVQRAVRDGELGLAEASHDKYRLTNRTAEGNDAMAGMEELPEALKSLAARGAAIHERVSRLDADMYAGRSDVQNRVGEQQAILEAAFGARA
ncbi:MAG: DUF1465 family protein [Hyphomonadaceae bacterium]